MKDYGKNKESSYLQYCDVNNLYSWVMSKKLPANKFEWIEDTSQVNEDFIKSYNEDSDEGYFLEVGVQYLQKLHELHNDLLCLPERMKIEKVETLVVNVHDKTKYVIHMRNLKQALNQWIMQFFETIQKTLRKHRDIKLVTKERRTNYFVNEAKCHTTKFFTEHLLAIEMKKNIYL